MWRSAMLYKARLITIILLSILFILLGCSNTTDPNYTAEIPVKTDDGWETAAPESVGILSDSLHSMIQHLETLENHMIHSILIIRRSFLVFEKYWNGYDVPLSGNLELVEKQFDMNTLHYQASVSKSVTSALVGIAYDIDLIESTDDYMFAYFHEYSDLKNEFNSSITIDNLLGMCSGYTWNEFEYGFNDPRDSHYQMFAAPDPMHYLLKREMINNPGDLFLYNSGDTNILGEIVRKVSQDEYLTVFAQKHLFGPLGIESFHWNRFNLDDRITFASSGLFLRPRDMAKIGQVYLDNGMWKDRRIISAEWVSESRSLVIPFIENYRTLYGYGYQWWLGRFPDGTEYYRATGWGGQYIYIIPEFDLVVVHTAGGYYDTRPVASTRLIENFILTAIIE